jgi:MFS family permease
MFAALPFYVFEVTGSVLATGLMFMIEILPSVLLGSLAGVFVDRWDRKGTMIGSLIFRGILLLPLVFFQSEEQVWIVYSVAFLQSVGYQFFGPANNALLPQLVKEKELITANSLDALGENSSRIFGPAIGGALLASFNLPGVVVMNTVGFMLAALLISAIKPPKSKEKAKNIEKAISLSQQWLNFAKEWISGLKLVNGRPALRYAFLAAGIALVGDSILSVLLVPFAQDLLGVGAVEFGWALTVRGIGGIMGGLLMGRIGARFKPQNLISSGLVGIGLVLSLMLIFQNFTVLLIVMLLLGPPAMAGFISAQTWLQQKTPDEYRGRVFGAFETIGAIMGLTGLAFATFFGESVGIVNSLGIGAVLFIFAGVMAFIWLRGDVVKE